MDKGDIPLLTKSDASKLVEKFLCNYHGNIDFLNRWLWDIMRLLEKRNNKLIVIQILKRAFLPNEKYAQDMLSITNITIIFEYCIKNFSFRENMDLLASVAKDNPCKTAFALLIMATSSNVLGMHKKYALFFLLMEIEGGPNCAKALREVNEMAKLMPEYFLIPVLKKQNLFLSLAMKVPLSARLLGAWMLELKKPMAKQYWQVHLKLSQLNYSL